MSRHKKKGVPTEQELSPDLRLSVLFQSIPDKMGTRYAPSDGEVWLMRFAALSAGKGSSFEAAVQELRSRDDTSNDVEFITALNRIERASAEFRKATIEYARALVNAVNLALEYHRASSEMGIAKAEFARQEERVAKRINGDG